MHMCTHTHTTHTHTHTHTHTAYARVTELDPFGFSSSTPALIADKFSGETIGLKRILKSQCPSMYTM
jgi:hypothetical protein